MHGHTPRTTAAAPQEPTPDEEFLRSAREARDVIAEAKQLVMERHHLPADQAFELLRHYSRSCDLPLRDVAFRMARGTWVTDV